MFPEPQPFESDYLQRVLAVASRNPLGVFFLFPRIATIGQNFASLRASFPGISQCNLRIDAQGQELFFISDKVFETPILAAGRHHDKK
jgi:hypothetical protein